MDDDRAAGYGWGKHVDGVVGAAYETGVRLVFRLMRRMLGLLVAAVLLLLAYLHAVGFPQVFQQFVRREFARRGIEAQFANIRLDLLRGVVVSGMRLASRSAPELTLAEVDEVQLQWNWRRLARRENALDAIRIANATVSIPTPADEVGTEYFRAQDAYARVRFEDDGAIRVERLTGLYAGLRLYVTGRLKLAPPATPPPTPPPRPGVAPAARQPVTMATKILRALNGVNVAQPPQFDLDFDVDLADPLAGRVLARLLGNGLRYRDLAVDEAAVEAELRAGAVELRRCQLTLYGGQITVTGRYDFAQSQFDLQFTSSTDPTQLAALLPAAVANELRDVHLTRNPRLTARYHLSPQTGTLPTLVGTLESGGVRYRGVELTGARAGFIVRGPDIELRDVLITTREGRLAGYGRYHVDSSEFIYHVDSTIDPTKLLPIMPPGIRAIVEPASFATPPHIVANVRGDFVDPDAFAYDATLEVGRCSYRGVPLQRAAGRLRLRENRLDADDVILERVEGALQGTVHTDFTTQRVDFDLVTTANPTELAPLLGPQAAQLMAAYRFGPRTWATGRGTVDFADAWRTAWTATVTNEGFATWKLAADRAHADLIFTNNAFTIYNFEAEAYDGLVRGRADFSFAQPEVKYWMSFDGTRLDVQKLLTALADGRPSRVTGYLSGEATLAGHGGDLGTLVGRGSLEVSEGVLWEGALFGPFSRILGNTKATSCQATFTVADRWVRTEDLKIAAGAFTALSRGRVSFDGELDFRIEAQFLRAWPGINIVSALLGKILEYKVGGTVSDPSYRPVNLPKELLPHEN